MGLEHRTRRSRVTCSTDKASQVPSGKRFQNCVRNAPSCCFLLFGAGQDSPLHTRPASLAAVSLSHRSHRSSFLRLFCIFRYDVFGGMDVFLFILFLIYIVMSGKFSALCLLMSCPSPIRTQRGRVMLRILAVIVSSCGHCNLGHFLAALNFLILSPAASNSMSLNIHSGLMGGPHILISRTWECDFIREKSSLQI